MKHILNEMIKSGEPYLDTLYSGNISKMFHFIESNPPLIAKGKKAQWIKYVREARFEYETMQRNKRNKRNKVS
jgi:hypothetical protein